MRVLDPQVNKPRTHRQALEKNTPRKVGKFWLNTCRLSGKKYFTLDMSGRLKKPPLVQTLNHRKVW